MTGFNKVVLVGNLTRDWEIRATKGGLAIGKSSIAVNRRRKDEEEETMFVDVVAFGKSRGCRSSSVAWGNNPGRTTRCIHDIAESR